MTEADKLNIKYNRLLGEFIGYMEGILDWEISDVLREKLTDKLKELNNIKL